MENSKEKISDSQKYMLRSLGISFPALEEAIEEKEKIKLKFKGAKQ